MEHEELHPLLKIFSTITSYPDIIGSSDIAQKFLEEMRLVPSRDTDPPLCCGKKMKVETDRRSKLGWLWRCAASKSTKKKGNTPCRKTKNPSNGTFCEGNHFKISMVDILIIIFGFVTGRKVTTIFMDLKNLRKQHNLENVHIDTISNIFTFCREVCEVIVSNLEISLGGIGKTVQFDETFLTKRKYNRGRVTEQMTVTVLGLFCKEDKTGVFFKVNSKSKQDLWPFIKKYVKYDTSRVATDGGKQYDGVQNLFSSSTIHLTTNHSKGEFVDINDPLNTINDLENQNKLFKQSLPCRRNLKNMHQYMAEFYYRSNILKKYETGSQIMQFLLDLAKVYPPFIDGMQQEPLLLRAIDEPTVESTGIEHLIPHKVPRLPTIDEEIGNALSDDDHDEDI